MSCRDGIAMCSGSATSNHHRAHDDRHTHSPFSETNAALVPHQSWRFFSHRIQDEESLLRLFFQSEYDAYAMRVPSGIPLIK